MRLFLLLAVVLAGGEAQASGGRSLPSGEEFPAVVEKVFTSPRGEVHFVEVAGGHSAFLRNNKGAVVALKETRGPSACDEWLVSAKAESLPAGCDFTFHDEETGSLYSVRSEELAEGNLFQAVRGTLRGSIVAL